jgi:uncharacterized protein
LSCTGVSSTESSLSIIREHGFSLLKSGTISLIPGIVLNEACLLNFEVIVVIVIIIEQMPDFRAAAIVSNAITKVVPGVYCDIETLIVETKRIEDNIKNIRENHNHTLRKGIYT